MPVAMRFFVPPPTEDEPMQKPWKALALAAAAWVLVSILSAWQFGPSTADGQVRLQHSDFGYYALLTMGLAESHVSDLWSAAMGSAVVPSVDVWYHWNPIWLAAGLSKVTGIPAWDGLYCVIAPIFQWLLVMLASVAVMSLVRWPLWAALLAGIVATGSVQWIKMFGISWVVDWLPNGPLQHLRYSALMHYPYFIDGALLLLSLVSWIKGKGRLAVAVLFIACVSSPHNVASAGATVGTWLGFGIVARRRDFWMPAAWATVTILCAWGMVKWGFSTDMPKADGQTMIALVPGEMLLNIRGGILDTCVGVALHLLLLPGLAALMRKPETEALGWLALSGIVGTYMAHGILERLSDGWHITALAHAVIIVPGSIFGLCQWWQSSQKWSRFAAGAIMTLTLCMGAHDLWRQQKAGGNLPVNEEQLLTIREALKGETFGYYTEHDRHWWISRHSTLAALAHARCVRLNRIKGVEADGHSRYYGHTRIETLLPRAPDQSEDDWSIKIAQKLGVRYILKTPLETIPAGVLPYLKLVVKAGDAELWAINDAAVAGTPH
jgi:hypothetical protein